jgi:hypothetical protein
MLYIRIYPYVHYKVAAAYTHGFEDNNLRIVEINNLSLQDIDKRLFEYLGVKPVKI